MQVPGASTRFTKQKSCNIQMIIVKVENLKYTLHNYNELSTAFNKQSTLIFIYSSPDMFLFSPDRKILSSTIWHILQLQDNSSCNYCTTF